MYDLTVIGAGWAGFNAALAAKEIGKKVCLIEKSLLGGTCLNRGCIPTKSLIHSVKIFSQTKKSQIFGIQVGSPQFDFRKAHQRKDGLLETLRSGMQFMLQGIDLETSEAQFLTSQEIAVGSKTIKSKYTLIATGSRPIELPILKFDGVRVLSSDHLLALTEIPASLAIIGGGVIGCEFASLFSQLGSQVSIIEKLPQLLPGEDQEIARKIETLFKKKGIKIYTSTDAQAVPLGEFSKVLVAVGRKANSEGLALENISLKTEKGKVITDDYLKTNIDNIYAAGDCTARLMLAHYASYQGRLAVTNIFNPNRAIKIQTATIPNCIFTDPEIASVGLNEKEALDNGIGIIVKKFDFRASGMAHILDETDGFIKIIGDEKTGQLIGGHIIGPKATELIAALTIAINSHLTFSQIKETIFAHPTLSESIGECAK